MIKTTLIELFSNWGINKVDGTERVPYTGYIMTFATHTFSVMNGTAFGGNGGRSQSGERERSAGLLG